MFDPRQHRLHLERAKRNVPDDADFLMRHVVDDMIDRLGAVKREFDTTIALFGRTAYLSDAMRECGQIKSVVRVEETAWLGKADIVCPATDALELEPNSADVILAPLSLHWAEDLPGALIQIHRALRPDGLFMAVLPGPETLRELREALLMAESEITGGAALRVDPFTDIRDAGALLQRAGLALPVVDQDTITVRYSQVQDLISDLRNFGATRRAGGEQPSLNRATLQRLSEIYDEKFSDPDGRIRTSFQMISLSGWKPHESQQKPLQPGSAKTRLAEALKTKERKL